MKLHKLSWAFVMTLFSFSTLFFGCRSKQTSNRQPGTSVYYTCSMHPQVHKDEPGNCPVCGMKLIRVAVSETAKGEGLDTALSYLTEPVTQTVVGSFKAIKPVEANPDDTITAEGHIGFDPRDVNTVTTRVTGRIEKLYVNYTGGHIRKGQPLMEIYSPQLTGAQRDLLQALQDHDQTLVAALKEQLLNLGMHASEVEEVMQSKQPLLKITIYSPYDGILQPLNTASVVLPMSDENTEATDPSTTQSELPDVRAGMYVNMGQTVFVIQDLSRTRAILDVFTKDLWHIHRGDALRIYADADPGRMISCRVDFIPPYRLQDEKTTRIVAYLSSLPEHWKIGTLIHGRIFIIGSNKGWYVPLSAVNRLGMRSIVWIQDKRHTHVFHAREVKTGLQIRDSIQIITGIQPGDQIAENAAYMVDSDSFIE